MAVQINQLAGQMLLASPSLQDAHFKDAVILVCHYDQEGGMGLIINRPRKIDMHEVLEDLNIPVLDQTRASHPVFEGGPVDDFRGFVLHDHCHIYDSTMQITTELNLTASRDILEDLGHGKGPEQYLLLLGYAGWGAGQMEKEISNNDWLVAPASQHIVFQEPPENRWDVAARGIGIERSQLSSQIGHA